MAKRRARENEMIEEIVKELRGTRSKIEPCHAATFSNAFVLDDDAGASFCEQYIYLSKISQDDLISVLTQRFPQFTKGLVREVKKKCPKVVQQTFHFATQTHPGMHIPDHNKKTLRGIICHAAGGGE